MKKIFFFLLILFGFSSIAHTQLQRLAVLPSSMAGGGDLASVCIDLFRDAPSNTSFSELGNAANKFDVNDFHSVKSSASEVLNNPKFIGETQENIPGYYKNFLNAKINEYKGSGPLTYEQHVNLQNEVWAYNGMDELGGFIQKSAADPLTDFENAKENFCFKYGLEGEEDNAETIVAKLMDLYDVKKGKPLSLSAFKFTDDHIYYEVAGAGHTIETYYDGVTFEEIKPYSGLVNEGVNIYNHNYHALPDIAEFSYHQNKQHEYLLSFEDEYGDYTMNFVIANDRITLIDLPVKERSVCYVR